MRLRTDKWTPIQIGGDYGGEPPPIDCCPLSRTWFNASMWNACKNVKERRALIAKVRRIEEANYPTPQRLGYVENVCWPTPGPKDYEAWKGVEAVGEQG